MGEHNTLEFLKILFLLKYKIHTEGPPILSLYFNKISQNKYVHITTLQNGVQEVPSISFGEPVVKESGN